MELWLPWIETAVPIVVGIAALVFAVKVGFKEAWKRIVLVTASIGLLVVCLLVSFFLFGAQGCEEDRQLIGSPDGKHVARLMIWGSVPTGTSLRVIERKSWSPIWHVVSDAGSIGTPLEPIEPHIAWRDNSHLVIDYPVHTEGSGFDCVGRQVGDILIVCKTHQIN
jgi:hypothetical protein